MEYDQEKGNSVRSNDRRCRKLRLIYGTWSKHNANGKTKLIALYEDNQIPWDTSLKEYRDILKK